MCSSTHHFLIFLYNMITIFICWFNMLWTHQEIILNWMCWTQPRWKWILQKIFTSSFLGTKFSSSCMSVLRSKRLESAIGMASCSSSMPMNCQENHWERGKAHFLPNAAWWHELQFSRSFAVDPHSRLAFLPYEGFKRFSLSGMRLLD